MSNVWNEPWYKIARPYERSRQIRGQSRRRFRTAVRRSRRCARGLLP